MNGLCGTGVGSGCPSWGYYPLVRAGSRILKTALASTMLMVHTIYYNCGVGMYNAEF